MIVGDAIDDVRDAWRAERLRTLATWAGVGWGAFAILALVAFGAGLQVHLAKAAEGMGEAVAVAWPMRTAEPWQGQPPGRIVRLTMDDVAAFRAAAPEVELASAEFVDMVGIERGALRMRILVSGVEPEYAALRNLSPRPGGRFLHRRDLDERRAVAFIGDRVAARLFDDGGDPVGRRVSLAGRPFTVIGVLEPKPQDSDYGGKDADRVVIPATTHADLFGVRYVDDVVFRARDAERQPAVVDALYRTLGRRAGFARDDRSALSIWDTAADQQVQRQIFHGLDLLFTASGAATLVVGAIGVANLTFVAVRRRRREIGLRLALGQRPGSVRATVLLTAVLHVAIGALAGTVLALTAVLAVRVSPLTDSIGSPFVPAGFAGATVAVLLALGLAAGWAPAKRAADADPAEALAG